MVISSSSEDAMFDMPSSDSFYVQQRPISAAPGPYMPRPLAQSPNQTRMVLSSSTKVAVFDMPLSDSLYMQHPTSAAPGPH
eukprot:scaffold36440_cov18-Tisochrysis_lutea.AAC.2